MGRFLLLAVLLVFLLGCAAAVPKASSKVGQGPDPVAGATRVADADWIDVSMLRPIAHFTTGSEPLFLKVTIENGKVVQFDSANDSEANLVVRYSRGAQSGTMVILESKLDVILKLDLHISPDAQHYKYTSSCPIIAHGADYEQWAHPIPWLAVSNPRVVAETDMACL